MSRKKLATSHGAKYSYWLDADRYVYQKRESDGAWIGWFCSSEAWDRTFRNWASLDQEAA